ncbi:hypothetical protein RV11_GL002860 [Enterococcus phoeniculicola]|uniref:BppU N-terminal domain-containing protein n=1 Tax=Enterococcus phoeniculicola ATCC BAA-412 TaxID=1158610 RepID=R3TKM9_9ENTE|nr:BppU family phage baseplate upper protein [Enterococcus phoeniculicola]EOL41618.1 hypothetical protein UC3_03182 [Enterococcus phoeniculicola ATCC BAA-412]EOT78888.1 hypothetical protein I589_00394 [Enterococcus phoeniculicola ATCC BAA-412]OJG72721.1 hypothetical protein RV11_GL002860 [Enterococcus phoeniculicola]
MSKWKLNLSTTEPAQFIGMIRVRQENKQTESVEVHISENGEPLDLTGGDVFLEVMIGTKAVQSKAVVVDAKKGIIRYTFDSYSMQKIGRIEGAQFVFYKGKSLIGSTQPFSYFVIRAVSQTKGETGSYWQTIEELIEEMTDFINSNKGEFTQWFEEVKNLLYEMDPGGTIVKELMEARKSITGHGYSSLSERLEADFTDLYAIDSSKIDGLITIQDDLFSQNHETVKLADVMFTTEKCARVIATIDDKNQDTFYLSKVGEINE